MTPDPACRDGRRTPGLTPAAAIISRHFREMRRRTMATGDEALRMSSRPLVVGTSDYMVELVVGARDLEDAMRRMARAYNLIHGGAYNRVERANGRLSYVVDDHAFPYAADVSSTDARTLVEGILIFLHVMLGLATGGPLDARLRQVRTRRPARGGLDDLLSFWRAPVRRGARTYALDYDGEAAALPMRGLGLKAAADVYDAISDDLERTQADGSSFPERVSAAIAGGVREQPSVARRLGVSTATLRRRLGAHGVTFRQMRALTLADSACALLSAGQDVVGVAERLGFADARSFNRAFKAWRGVTPAAFVGRP